MNEEEIFHEALARNLPEERDAYLEQACAGNQPLRASVKALLRANVGASGFLGDPLLSFGATWDEPIVERPGTIIGPYKLLEQIGEGGMGTVFMAEQTEPVQRKVALKIVKPGMDSRQVIARFEAERQALAMMDHPNIAKVLDAGTTGESSRHTPCAAAEDGTQSVPTTLGRPYFVMELVKGVPITKYCDDHNLTPKERLELFIPVCHAVQHAHQKGIIHRDLKPSNVMVACYDDKPVPKVIDFGIAKATGQKLTERTLFTQFGQLVGTLEYMSPEQATLNALDVDTRSDIYSLGVLLYELLTGSTPLEKKRLKSAAFDEILRVIREEETPPPSTRLLGTAELPNIAAQRKTEPAKLSRLVRGDLDLIAMKALEKDRNHRYETANGLAEDIRRHLADEPVLAGPPSAIYRLRKFARRHRGGILVAAAVTMAFIALAGVGWLIRDQEWRQAERKRNVQEGLNQAQTLLKEDQPDLARQRLEIAKGLLANDREAFPGLASEIDDFLAKLDRFRRFFDRVDQAHFVELNPVEGQSARTIGVGAYEDRSTGNFDSLERQPARAVPLVLEALARYEILERDDWRAALEKADLGKNQEEQVRRIAYEELLWLAQDVMERREDHRSREKLVANPAAQRALAYLRQAEKAHPPTQSFYQLRANCNEIQGDNKAARDDQTRAEETSPTLAFDYYLKGQAAYNAHNKAEAVTAFEAGLLVEPTHFWSLMMLGNCLCNLGQGPHDFEQAVWVYTGCIQTRPRYDNAYSFRGVAYLQLRRFDEALGDFSKSIHLNPKDATGWNGRGLAYAEMRQYEKAIADFSEAIRLDSGFASAFANRGAIRLRRPPQYDKAIADLSEATRLHPKMVLAWHNRGLAFQGLRRYDEALVDIAKAMELDPKLGPAWASRAKIFLELGEFKKALDDLSTALAKKPPRFELGKTWYTRGSVHQALGRHEEAMDDFSKAIADYSKVIDFHPHLSEPWAFRADAYVQTGKYAEAIADSTESLKWDAKDAKVWALRALAHVRAGQLPKAIDDYSESLKLDPNDVSTWALRGIARFRDGKAATAIADYSEAIKRDDKDARLRGLRAEAYLDSATFFIAMM